MPPRYPSYPYVEPLACGQSDAEIDDTIADMISQTPGLTVKDGGPPDVLCRALNVDIEYSGPPHEILLDVPLDRKAVIYLPKRGKPRQDRFMAAMGIGHWILHVPPTREAHPGCGIQVLHAPTDRGAMREARRFARALLMPKEEFCTLWYEGHAVLVAETLNVPTQQVYERASTLDLPPENGAGDRYEWAERAEF
ncbi:ImmA/IrrE family metallo-endopeptidase [Antarctobacter jejuensis]|uniref:ImmA/IrrE family metallo-endopeptidase n=1 Tax=Antarctobacter jejuensis TaxID=1439938 RepID=UPI003FD13D09